MLLQQIAIGLKLLLDFPHPQIGEMLSLDPQTTGTVAAGAGRYDVSLLQFPPLKRSGARVATQDH